MALKSCRERCLVRHGHVQAVTLPRRLGMNVRGTGEREWDKERGRGRGGERGREGMRAATFLLVLFFGMFVLFCDFL